MAVGVGVTVGLGVAVDVGVEVAVGLGVAVAVGVTVGVGFGVGVTVGVAVGLGVGVAVDVGLGVAVGVTVGVGVGVGVTVGFGVGVAVGLGVGLGVTVGVGVGRRRVIHWVGDTPPAAVHRTHAVSVASLSLADRDGVYVKRAWPFTFVFFDIQSANGPVIAAAFCTDTFCDGTALPLFLLTVQVITERPLT